MDSPEAASANPQVAGTLSRILTPIRGRLCVAAGLAAVGGMLTLVPLAAIAHIAARVLGAGGQLSSEVWWVVGLSALSLFAGMALIFTAELLAHLADNRLTHHLRRAITQRLSRVPLGWFSSEQRGK
jgi:ATP-binding cassette, subfamily B, bacterial IrtA/YbtP